MKKLHPPDPLAPPTRARLLTLLAELKRPASTAEIAETLGLHPNGVRVQLGKLAEAGLVDRARAPRSRGRPADQWSLAPGARVARARSEEYRDLVRWLARAMPPDATSLRRVERTGREIGHELADASEGRALDETLHGLLDALGFQPKLTVTAHHLRFELANCPYREAVHENQPVICTLHRGISAGMAEAAPGRARLSRFVARDPDKAGCLIEIERAPADR